MSSEDTSPGLKIISLCEVSKILICFKRIFECCHFHFCQLAARWLTQMVTHSTPFSLQLITNVLQLQSAAGAAQSENTKRSPGFTRFTRITRNNHQNQYYHQWQSVTVTVRWCSSKWNHKKGQTRAGTWQEEVNLEIRLSSLSQASNVERMLKQFLLKSVLNSRFKC